MKRKKILIVDDDPDIRIFVSTVVETMGCEPIAAEDGVEALDVAGSSPPESSRSRAHRCRVATTR